MNCPNCGVDIEAFEREKVERGKAEKDLELKEAEFQKVHGRGLRKLYWKCFFLCGLAGGILALTTMFCLCYFLFRDTPLFLVILFWEHGSIWMFFVLFGVAFWGLGSLMARQIRDRKGIKLHKESGFH